MPWHILTRKDPLQAHLRERIDSAVSSHAALEKAHEEVAGRRLDALDGEGGVVKKVDDLEGRVNAQGEDQVR